MKNLMNVLLNVIEITCPDCGCKDYSCECALHFPCGCYAPEAMYEGCEICNPPAPEPTPEEIRYSKAHKVYGKEQNRYYNLVASLEFLQWAEVKNVASEFIREHAASFGVNPSETIDVFVLPQLDMDEVDQAATYQIEDRYAYRSIKLSADLFEYDDLWIDVLKHECVHFLCHIGGHQYWDGSKYFENALKRLGISSSPSSSTDWLDSMFK